MKQKPAPPLKETLVNTDLSKEIFSGLLKAYELRSAREDAIKFLAIWEAAQLHPDMTAEQGLEKWLDDRKD